MVNSILGWPRTRSISPASSTGVRELSGALRDSARTFALAKMVIRPEDLHGVDYVALSPEDRARLQLDQLCLDAGAKPNLVIERRFATTACTLALEGAGVGTVNPLAVDGFAERGLILRPFAPAVYFGSYLLFRSDMQKARLVRAFVSALMEVRNIRHQVRSARLPVREESAVCVPSVHSGGRLFANGNASAHRSLFKDDRSSASRRQNLLEPRT